MLLYEPARLDLHGLSVVILHEIRAGLPWRQAAGSAFGGQGSCGNGAAMRVAPLGAYHADQPRQAARQALASAEVTHAHPEGVVGAVVVAVCAADAAAARLAGTRPPAVEILDRLSPYLIDGQVQRGIGRARRLLRAGVGVAEAAIVGIVAAYTGIGDRPGTTGIPSPWLKTREALPAWASRDHQPN